MITCRSKTAPRRGKSVCRPWRSASQHVPSSHGYYLALAIAAVCSSASTVAEPIQNGLSASHIMSNPLDNITSSNNGRESDRKLLQADRNERGYCSHSRDCAGEISGGAFCQQSSATCESQCSLNWCPADGFCTWKSCSQDPGKVTGWCQIGANQCSICKGTWCLDPSPTPAPTPPPEIGGYGYCSWTCNRLPTTAKWCGKSESNCGSCKLTWCPTDGYCGIGGCVGDDPHTNAWCSASEQQCSRCEGGQWCVAPPTPGPTTPTPLNIPEFFGWHPTLVNVVAKALDGFP